mgnify:CR=1 FL=1
MFAFEAGLCYPLLDPNGFATEFIKLDDLAGPRVIPPVQDTVDQLQIEMVIDQQRRRCHAELNVYLPEALPNVKLPLLFALEVIAGQYTS